MLNITSCQYTNVSLYHTIVINNILSYCILISFAFMCIPCIKIYNKLNETLSVFHSKFHHIENEIHRIKCKSLDIVDTNFVLHRKFEDLNSEIQRIKYKQLETNKNIVSLQSQSFDSYDNDKNYKTKIDSLEQQLNVLKQKQLLYQKDTALFKYLVNDIQKLKTKYDELQKHIY